MIKSFKRLLVFSVCALVLPICVKADGFSVNVTCSKLDGTACPISNNVYQVSTGEKVNLTFTISSTDAISFSGTVSLSDKITGLSDFDPNFSYWADLSQATGNNGYENDRIGLMKKNTGASGDPKFSFSVTGGNTTGNATVEISSISIMNAQNTGVNIDDVIVNLAIVESASNSNTNTNENTNTGTNTNENTNTNEDDIHFISWHFRDTSFHQRIDPPGDDRRHDPEGHRVLETYLPHDVAEVLTIVPKLQIGIDEKPHRKLDDRAKQCSR